MKKLLLSLLLCTLLFTSCVENYSNGERIGVITKFSKSGVWFDSWDGHLNVTQTGMNTSGEPFEFSVDNEKNNPIVIATLDSAANRGWKVKLIYHQTWGFKNNFGNRGDTDYFIDSVVVLDRHFTEHTQLNNNASTSEIDAKAIAKNAISSINKQTKIHTRIDTIYIVLKQK